MCCEIKYCNVIQMCSFIWCEFGGVRERMRCGEQFSNSVNRVVQLVNHTGVFSAYSGLMGLCGNSEDEL
jgi:hypothetical protein